MAIIDFLHLGPAFSGQTLRSHSMGGTESSIIELAEALAARGHDVAVFNGVTRPTEEYGVAWLPFASAPQKARGQFGIAVSSPKAFAGLSFRSNILWLHNPTKSWRQIRRGNLPSLLRTRPHAILLGDYHDAHVPKWLPFRSRTKIHHGVSRDFFRESPATKAPAPVAIYTSQPYRGLDWLLDLWGEVKSRVPDASFRVFAPKLHQAEANAALAVSNGVDFRGSISRPRLIGELVQARVQLIPGHWDETFCLAAAEATAAGIPIVTLGKGALGERVSNGKTGFAVCSREEFLARTVALLTDDALWREMHAACLAEAALTTWDKRAEEWERLFLSL